MSKAASLFFVYKLLLNKEESVLTTFSFFLAIFIPITKCNTFSVQDDGLKKQFSSAN